MGLKNLERYVLSYVIKNNGITYAEALDWINEHGDMDIKYE